MVIARICRFLKIDTYVTDSVSTLARISIGIYCFWTQFFQNLHLNIAARIEKGPEEKKLKLPAIYIGKHALFVVYDAIGDS